MRLKTDNQIIIFLDIEIKYRNLRNRDINFKVRNCVGKNTNDVSFSNSFSSLCIYASVSCDLRARNKSMNESGEDKVNNFEENLRAHGA